MRTVQAKELITKPETVTLKCDMVEGCPEPITYIDDRGFIYCTKHGKDRQYGQNCRKLRAHEINRLKRGEAVRRY